MKDAMRSPEPPVENDGRHDFDFILGRWRTLNRRRDDVLDPSANWTEFDSQIEALRILGGLGHAETFSTQTFPGRGQFTGYTIRLFDPSSRLQRLFWISCAQTAVIEQPVVGQFVEGRGIFECDDVVGGRSVRVRYTWKDIMATTAAWEQSFSFDGGMSWDTNWTAHHRRTD